LEKASLVGASPLTEAEPADLFAFDNSYAQLPEGFYAKLSPSPVSAPRLVRLNEGLARDLNLDPEALASPEGIAVLAGNRTPERGEPLAMAYAGHQFGVFVPQLGDGRAILIGEVIGRDGVRRDIQLKGSGRTPFSRSGDGRAALGPVLREYIVSEAMAALGVPTTRSLAAVMTGETVVRDRLLPGAVLTRVALGHVRVGTFEFFSARGDVDSTRRLADYVIARHYPEAAGAENPYLALLDLAIARQASLVAQWLCIGFIHGVMNTDNMSVAGETIDYGPCAFMDAYHPATVFSSIDHYGRYAYANQPRIAQWNLARLAETLLPHLAGDEAAAIEIATEAVAGFVPRFDAAFVAGLRRKLGLLREEAEDLALAKDLLDRMAEGGADFSLTFRRLCDAADGPHRENEARTLFADPGAFDAWAARWRERLLRDGGDSSERQALMRASNPAFIPRNHLVEEAIAAAQDAGDFTPFEKLLAVLAKPYEDQPEAARYAAPPLPDQIVRQTFCGT
jgi:serine/tyrosine/threonine adenylyltransferase